MKRLVFRLLLLALLRSPVMAYGGPVDIAALARGDQQQATEEKTADAGRNSEWGWSAILLSLGMISTGAAEIAIVFLLVRQSGKREAAVVPAGVPGRAVVAVSSDGSAGAALAAEDRLTADTVMEEGQEQLEERAALLAEQMHRGKGEMNLALRLESRSDETPAIDIQQLRAAGSSGTQRVKTARRLGVGRGEIDLAMRLKALEGSGDGKETKA